MEKIYAQAIQRALKNSDEKSVVKGLLGHLKERGRMKLLPGILRELKSESLRGRNLEGSVEVASEKEAKAALLAAKAEGIDATRAVVNESLISGWRATGNGLLIDRSAKRALVDLYRQITK